MNQLVRWPSGKSITFLYLSITKFFVVKQNSTSRLDLTNYRTIVGDCIMYSEKINTTIIFKIIRACVALLGCWTQEAFTSLSEVGQTNTCNKDYFEVIWGYILTIVSQFWTDINNTQGNTDYFVFICNCLKFPIWLLYYL